VLTKNAVQHLNTRSSADADKPARRV